MERVQLVLTDLGEMEDAIFKQRREDEVRRCHCFLRSLFVTTFNIATSTHKEITLKNYLDKFKVY